MAGRDRMTIEEVVRQVLRDEHADVIRESVRAVARELMEVEVSELVGAELGERRPDDRATHRNGYRSRRWDTRAGEIELQIPKIRQGSYFPSFLEPRRRSEQALLAVVQQAYVCGVSTRRVDQLVESLGLRVSKSEVSRVCGALDEHVEAFRTRPLEGAYPYLFLDAKVEKVRDGGRVVNKALVIAHGVHETGRREILSIDVGEAETEAFWTDFLRGLVKRGLTGVQVAISDAHAGLKAAIAMVLGCAWQRCTVHFLRDCLGHARKDQHGLLAALIRPIFNAESLEQARDRLSEAIAHLDGRMSKVATLLEDAETDVLAFYAFPAAHWSKLRSTNPLERFNKEIGRRTDVVGIFPNDQALIRLAGMLCIEQNDEWLVGRAYLSAESLSEVLGSQEQNSQDPQANRRRSLNQKEKEMAELQPA
jgi:putative transposase